MKQKVVLKLDLHDDRQKQKALKAVSTLLGIDSIAMDMKAQKMTVIGSADPVNVVKKLRKLWPPTGIVSVEEEKGDKKTGGSGDNKQDGDKPVYMYPPWYYWYPHFVHSAEEDPNSCVIF